MAKDVLQKLLRSKNKLRKSDLLSDQEYLELSTMSFDEYYRSNFNSGQLLTITTSEANHLERFHEELEKKVERTQKRIRDKRVKKKTPTDKHPVPGPIVSHPKNAEVDTTQQDALQDSSTIRHLVDDIEKRMVEEPIQDAEQHPAPEQQAVVEIRPPTEDDLEPALRNLNESFSMIDLQQNFPPKEMLIQESDLPLHDTIDDEIDLGPPGDAAAFFGADHPMPLSDRSVYNQLLQEFPTLGRPKRAGRFEELEVALAPPLITDLRTSTPIGSNPVMRRFYKTDLSAIKGPSTIGDNRKSEEQAEQVVPTAVPETAETQAILPIQEALPSSETVRENVVSEPIQISSLTQVQTTEMEPTEEIIVPPVPGIETGTTPPNRHVPVDIESHSSAEQPVKKPRRVCKPKRRARIFSAQHNPAASHSRTTFSNFDLNRNDSMETFEQTRALIQTILDQRVTRPGPTIHSSLIRRDISDAADELNSIRGPRVNQSNLYPIQERPEREEEQQFQDVAPSVIGPDITSIQTLSEILPGDANTILDTGLGNQMLFQNSSVDLSLRQVTIPDIPVTSSYLNQGTSGIGNKSPVGRSRLQAEHGNAVDEQRQAVSTFSIPQIPQRRTPPSEPITATVTEQPQVDPNNETSSAAPDHTSPLGKRPLNDSTDVGEHELLVEEDEEGVPLPPPQRTEDDRRTSIIADFDLSKSTFQTQNNPIPSPSPRAPKVSRISSPNPPPVETIHLVDSEELPAPVAMEDFRFDETQMGPLAGTKKSFTQDIVTGFLNTQSDFFETQMVSIGPILLLLGLWARLIKFAVENPIHRHQGMATNSFISVFFFFQILISMLKLYITLQRELVEQNRKYVTMDRLTQITNSDRVPSVRRFRQLLTLKKWGFIEIKADETSGIQRILLDKNKRKKTRGYTPMD
ncbi:uncharacterized protein LOC134206868 [Armigeres subalbatus]|uniref:uncharacterized protein LOC134206868 n=1 Tax=Armigeres subalbatus TaxID=124917 RepID=UPI002ED46CE2